MSCKRWVEHCEHENLFEVYHERRNALGRREDPNYKIITFHVEGVKLENFTLTDIGDYVSDFGQLVGRDVEPRFHSLKNGSMTLNIQVPAM